MIIVRLYKITMRLSSSRFSSCHPSGTVTDARNTILLAIKGCFEII